MAACPVYGFVVEFTTRDLDDAAQTALLDSFIRDAIESRGLICGGGILGGAWRHVVESEAAQATDADREAVLAWSRGHPDIVSAVVGPIIDLDSEDD